MIAMKGHRFVSLFTLVCVSLLVPVVPFSFTKGLAALTCGHRQGYHRAIEVFDVVSQNFAAQKTIANKFLYILGHAFLNNTYCDASLLSTSDVTNFLDPLMIPFQELLLSANNNLARFESDSEAFIEAAMKVELGELFSTTNKLSPYATCSFWIDQEHFTINDTVQDNLYHQVAQSEMLLFLFEYGPEFEDDYLVNTLQPHFTWGDLQSLGHLHEQYFFRKNHRYTAFDYQSYVYMVTSPPLLEDNIPTVCLGNVIGSWLRMDQSLFYSHIKRLKKDGLKKENIRHFMNEYDFDVLIAEMRFGMDVLVAQKNRLDSIRSLFHKLDCDALVQSCPRHSVFALLYCRSKNTDLYENLAEERVASLTDSYMDISKYIIFRQALTNMYTQLLKNNVAVGNFSYLNSWHFAHLKSNEGLDEGVRFYNTFMNLSDAQMRPALRFLNCDLAPDAKLKLLDQMNDQGLCVIQSSMTKFFDILDPMIHPTYSLLHAIYVNFVVTAIPKRVYLDYCHKEPFYMTLSNATFWTLPPSELLSIWLNTNVSFHFYNGVECSMDEDRLERILSSLSNATTGTILRDTSLFFSHKVDILHRRLPIELFARLAPNALVEAFLSPHLNMTVYEHMTFALFRRVWKDLSSDDEPSALGLVSRLNAAKVWIGSETGLTLSDCQALLSNPYQRLSDKAIVRFKSVLVEDTMPDIRNSTLGLDSSLGPDKSNRFTVPNDATPFCASSLLSIICLYSIYFATIMVA